MNLMGSLINVSWDGFKGGRGPRPSFKSLPPCFPADGLAFSGADIKFGCNDKFLLLSTFVRQRDTLLSLFEYIQLYSP